MHDVAAVPVSSLGMPLPGQCVCGSSQCHNPGSPCGSSHSRLYLEYHFGLTVFGHVPQLSSQAAAVLHLSCASAPAASEWLPKTHAHNCRTCVHQSIDCCEMLIKFVNGLCNLLLLRSCHTNGIT